MKTILTFSVLLIFAILGIDFFNKSGTFLFLDSVFYPIYNLSPFFSQSLYWHLRDILTMILWYQIYSKIFLASTLGIWAFLWYKIWKVINKLLNINNKIKFIIKILSISFILINPFIYERLVTQTWIVLAVFIIWLWFIFLLDFLTNNHSNKNIYISSLFFGIAFTIMPHSIIFILIIFINTLIFFFKKFNLKNITLSILIFIVININWIIWTIFLSENKTLQTISTFNFKNIEVFTSNNLDWLGVELTNLLLYWFWWEKYWHLMIPITLNNKWFIWWFIILFIINLWIYNIYKKQRKISLYLLSIWIISYILSLGISSNIFININKFLYENIPYYIWMREPQKLTWLLAIIYAIFFLSGLSFLYEKFIKSEKKYYLNQKKVKYITIFIFLIILSWSPSMLFWLWWQLKMIDYPKSYFEARTFLMENKKNEQSLVLPWHSYMWCSWTRWKVISNIMWEILKPNNIIVSDNIEISSLYTNSINKKSKKIEKFLQNKNYSILKEINIDNIILLKNCADFKNYEYLWKSKKIEKIFSSKNLIIYKIK